MSLSIAEVVCVLHHSNVWLRNAKLYKAQVLFYKEEIKLQSSKGYNTHTHPTSQKWLQIVFFECKPIF